MSWETLYGHEKPKAILRAALEQERIAHAYLFYGMAGIGKRSVALNFAKALNCTRRRELLDACDSCISCRKADHRNHPDIEIIEAQGQFIHKAAVDELQERIKFRPSEGSRCVFIIDEADRLRTEAANALLKTLEEPPPAALLILVTARPHQLPATVLSRCQQVSFTPLPRETVARFLVERLALGSEEADVIAAAAGGSIAHALATNRDDFLALRAQVMAAMAGGWRGKPGNLLALLSSLHGYKREVPECLAVLRSCFSDALRWRETRERVGLTNGDRMDLVEALAARLTGRELLACLETIDAAGRALDANANRALTLEWMAFKLAAVW